MNTERISIKDNVSIDSEITDKSTIDFHNTFLFKLKKYFPGGN